VNAYYCIEQIYNLLSPTIEQKTYVDSAHNITIDKPYINELYINGSLRYEQVLRADSLHIDENREQLVQVVFKRAELRFHNEMQTEAYADYEELLTLQPADTEVRKVVLDRLAYLNTQQGNYAQAEDYYRRSLDFAKNAEERKTIENNIAAAIQSGGNAFRDSGDYAKAAEEYLRLAAQVRQSDADASIAFMAQAVDMYNKIPDYRSSINLLREMAGMRAEKSQVLAYYVTAWNTADSLMQNEALGDSLRWAFVNDLYPGSNEAYHIELNMIQRYEKSADTTDKEHAAQMYVSLHDRADNIDMGEDKPENLYLNAIRLYQELGRDDTFISMMLAFEKMYPQHEMANQFLVAVATKYHERGDDAGSRNWPSTFTRRIPAFRCSSPLPPESSRMPSPRPTTHSTPVTTTSCART
jgi:tetratricopeptide (TPR) repeat protein